MSRSSNVHLARPNVLVEAVGEQLAKLVVRARATTAQAAARFHPDLPPAAFHVARWLSSFGPGRTSEISDGIAMDRSAVSRLIVALRATGMVRVEPDLTDRRASLVSLTADGRRHLAAANEWKGARLHDRLATWSPSDLAELARLLAQFNSSEV